MPVLMLKPSQLIANQFASLKAWLEKLIDLAFPVPHTLAGILLVFAWPMLAIKNESERAELLGRKNSDLNTAQWGLFIVLMLDIALLFQLTSSAYFTMIGVTLTVVALLVVAITALALRLFGGSFSPIDDEDRHRAEEMYWLNKNEPASN